VENIHDQSSRKMGWLDENKAILEILTSIKKLAPI
jgi:hypothetical protein